MTSRRAFIAGGIAAASCPAALSAAPPSGEMGWILMDAETGAVIDSEAADGRFIPASTTKSVTALLTLSTLPPTTRFLTRIHATGVLEDGVLYGDLILVGGGDPALDTGDLAQLAKALRVKGVRRITGGFRVTAIDGPNEAVLNPHQPLQANYNPAIGSLCLNFNRVLLRWRRRNGKTKLTTHAHADSHSVPARSVLFRASPTNDSPVHDMIDGRERWTIPARDLQRDGERWFPVRDPIAYAGEVFRSLCAETGLTLPPPQRSRIIPTDTPLAMHRSDVVFAQTKKMMKFSNNLTAEVLGIAAARQLSGAPSTVDAAARATTDWVRNEAKIEDDLTLANHSGLSSASRITPRQMAEILRLGYRRFGGGYVSIHSQGKLRRVRGPLPAYTFRAKTGTMNYVRALAGFLKVEGRQAIFVIFHMDSARRAALDAAYTPYDERRPPGSGLWLRGALNHENALLTGWVRRKLR